VFTGAPTPSATRRRTGSGPPAAPSVAPSTSSNSRPNAARGRGRSGSAGGGGGRLGLGLGRQLQGRSNVVGRTSSLPPAGKRVAQGKILSYDANKGYGFIQSREVAGDVYFQKKELPQLVQSKPGNLQDKVVNFEVTMTADGKARGHHIVILNPTGTGVSASTGPRRERRRNRARDPEGPLPDLSDDVVEAMTKYLEDNGGSADFGKFCREFKAVKKAQVQKHFLLEAEDNSGGKVTISICDPSLLPPPGEEGNAAEEGEPLEAVGGELPNDEWLGRFIGVLHALHDTRGGYGFIKCEEVEEGDAYFKRDDLPEDAKALKRTALVGQQVEFDAILNKDRKPRAENITFVNELPLPGEEPENTTSKPDEKSSGRDAKKAPADLPPLPIETLEEMIGFLMENDGCMDYGRFANRFSGVKKQQLLPHKDELVLIQQDSNSGGRWKIAVPGCEHLGEDEATTAATKTTTTTTTTRTITPTPAARERPGNDKKKPQPAQPSSSSSSSKGFQPSAGLWLTGVVTKWDLQKQFGFLQVKDAPDVFLHRDVLPEELASTRNLQGVEFAFEVTTTDEGKPRANTAKPLLMADGVGGWQLRRVK